MYYYESEVYIEGIKVDFLGWNVTVTGGASSGIIALRPVPSAYKLKPGSHIAIFFKNNYMDDFVLLVDGYITTKMFTHPNKAIRYGFQSVGQRFKLAQLFKTSLQKNPINETVISQRLKEKLIAVSSTGIASEIYNAIVKDKSIIKGIKTYLHKLLNHSDDVKAKNKPSLDKETVNYIQSTKLLDRIRLLVEDDIIHKMMLDEGFKSFVQGIDNNISGNVSLFTAITQYLSKFFFKIYEPLCPPQGGAFDFLPVMHLQIPPKCNIVRPEQISGSENMMLKPTMTRILTVSTGLTGNLQTSSWFLKNEAIYPEDGQEPEYNYKGVMLQYIPNLPLPLLSRSNYIKEWEVRTAKYFHYLGRSNMFVLSNIVSPYFDPYLVAGLPALIINPSGDHVIGTIETITHSWNVDGNVSTSLNLSHCVWLDEAAKEKLNVPHPWINADMETLAKKLYEGGYGTEALGLTFEETQKDLKTIQKEYLNKRMDEIEFIEYKKRKNVWTKKDYFNTIKVSNEVRKAAVEEYVKQSKSLANKGAEYYAEI